MKYQYKYFDIGTRAKKINGWERSLLELKRMMHGDNQNYNPRTKGFQKKAKG